MFVVIMFSEFGRIIMILDILFRYRIMSYLSRFDFYFFGIFIYGNYYM